jgi:hypothetical protein
MLKRLLPGRCCSSPSRRRPRSTAAGPARWHPVPAAKRLGRAGHRLAGGRQSEANHEQLYLLDGVGHLGNRSRSPPSATVASAA